MTRKMMGFVPGGMQSYALPAPIRPGDLALHATGRLNTMSEIMVQAAFLRSAGFAHQATGFSRAVFQDVKGDYSGTNRIAAAHRALFALHLDGTNAAYLARVLARPDLQRLTIAPQARTDLVIRPVNYADQLLENAISARVFELIRRTLALQRPGGAIEKNLLIDAIFEFKKLLHIGFDEALGTFQRGVREKGWQEYRPGHGPGPLAGVSDAEIDRFLDKAFGGGMTIDVSGPTKQGNLTEVVLATSQEITDHAIPEIATGDTFEATVASHARAAESTVTRSD